MTVIVFDGHTLAADKRGTHGNLITTTTKIHRLPDGSLVGFAGDSAYCRQLLAWMVGGENPADFPETQRDRDKFAGAMVIRKNGEIWKYEDTPHPYRIEDRCYAIGSGRDFAMAAMYLGKTAAEAVEVASAMDCGCGNGVDTFELNAVPLPELVAA